MVYTLFLLLLFVYAVSFFEERLKRYNLAIYAIVWVVLVFCATTKEIGFDRDSEQYEYIFNHLDDPFVQLSKEWSFLTLCRITYLFTNDIHILFFFYAGIGISLKFYAFRQYSEHWFLPILIFMGHYYLIQDLTQIRAALTCGIFLLAVKPLAEGNKGKAALLILLSCFFHYSALILLPALFLNNNDMTKRQRLYWAAIIPLGYAICLLHINSLSNIPIPYIGDKLATYQEMSERGLVSGSANIFNAVFLVTCAIYLYCLYFYDTIRQHNQYLPIMLKLMGVSVCSFLAFSFLSVLAFRVSELYGVIEIILFTNVFYTIRPNWLAKTVVGIIAVSLFSINVFYSEIFTL